MNPAAVAGWLVPPSTSKEPAWRFVVRVFTYIALFFLAFLSLIHAVPEAAGPAATGTAWLSTQLLRLFGTGATCDGITIELEHFQFTIIYECTGIYSSLIFLSCVLAYPATLRRKAIGIAWGIPAIVGINIARVAVLAAVGNRFPDQFDFIHGYLWQVTIILIVGILWLVWLSGAAKDG